MSKPECSPGIHSAIAEAIRSKRGERHTATAADLEAMEAALVAEIEAFERRTADSPAPAASSGGSAAPDSKEDSKLFPEIVSDGVQRTSRSEPEAKGAMGSPGASAKAGGPPAPKPGFLDQLRQQAQAQQQSDGTRQQEHAAQLKRMDAALRSIFSYCHELVQQLNVLRPPVDRDYALLGSFALSGLAWKAGFADYRTHPDSAEALYETVLLSCQLAKSGSVQIERDGISAESYRKSLFDLGLAFTCDEIRNARHMVEKVIFSISTEVTVNLKWRAVPDRGVLMLETRNLERFGSLVYEIAPASVGQAMLDELARLLLGQPSRFRDYCSNLRPSAHNR